MKSSGVMTQTQVYSSIAETHRLKAKHATGVVEVLVPHRTFCCSAEFPFVVQVLVPHRQIASPPGATSDSSFGEMVGDTCLALCETVCGYTGSSFSWLINNIEQFSDNFMFIYM